MIVLTDGQSDLYPNQIQEIHRRLAAANARLFLVGIGATHNKGILQALAAEKGTYIDTTEDGKTIVGSISSIYEQVLATFNQLELRISQLRGNEWSLGGKRSVQKGEYSVCNLEDIIEDTPREHVIKIHSKDLPAKFALSRLTFELVYKDPEGKQGIVTIPWNANTVIDPYIFTKT